MLNVLKNKNYFHLFLAMSISKLGTSFFLIALPLLVYELTKSPSLMAIAYVLEVTPQVLFSLFGGALADQINRKKMMMIGDCLSALLIMVIPIAHMLDFLHIWLIFTVVFLLAGISAFYHPSFEAVVPEVLASDNLVQGNALFKLAETITTFIGPALAGVLVAVVGAVHVLYLTCFTFLLSACFILFIHLERNIRQTAKIEIFKPIKEGISYVFKSKGILIGTLFIFCVNIGFGAMEALYMYFLKGVLQLDARLIGFVFSTHMLGSLFAVYLANKWQYLPRGNIIVLSGIAIGLGQLLLVAAQSFFVMIILCGIIIHGAATLMAINWFTYRQEVVPQHLLGRVISSTRMVTFLALPISGMIAGLLTELISIQVIFVTAGVFVLIFSMMAVKSELCTVSKLTEVRKSEKQS